MVVQVTREEHISGARRATAALADAASFSRLMTAYVTTAVSELASNLFFHSDGGGAITMVVVDQDGRRGIEIVAEHFVQGPAVHNRHGRRISADQF